MHELAITQSILDIAVSEAAKHQAARVLSIKIKIGEYSGVVPQLIQEYYNIVSEGTVAAAARLVIEKVPLRVTCTNCGAENQIDKRKIKCPACGSVNLKMLSGREFYVESLEVE